MKNKIILLFCMVFLVGIISAPATVVNIKGDETMQIQPPLFETHQQGEDLHLRFHAYNKTNGILFKNTEVTCTYHIYRPNNTVIGMSGDTTAGGTYCQKVDVGGGNFTELGNYFYYVHCNNSLRGGFIAGQFEVTPSGNIIPSEAQNIFLISIGSMIFISLLFFFISGKFKDGDSENKALKFGFIGLSLVIGLIALLYSYIATSEFFSGFERIMESYYIFIYVILTVFFIIFIFIMINLLVKVFDSFKIKKGLK